ncbi:MAG: hypothetical protein K2G13_02780 [Muribaculaceae bacterium]|nr:hypothetical protein [Muribaculaceae bacterium]
MCETREKLGCRSDISEIGNRPYYERHTCHIEAPFNHRMDYKGFGA